MSEYPRALYRIAADGDTFLDDERLVAWAHITVADVDEAKAAKADGWIEADDAVAGLTARDPLDHDGDGRKGGSRRRKAAASE